jgi:hypothetical protein
MSHQQVTFNLLESVEHNTNQNQKRSATVKLGELVIYTGHHGK